MNHYEGFETEGKFHEALLYLCERYHGFKSKDLKVILEKIDPIKYKRLFERRPCLRQLIYVGETNNHFIQGAQYQCCSFNGATYEVYEENKQLIIAGYINFQCI